MANKRRVDAKLARVTEVNVVDVALKGKKSIMGRGGPISTVVPRAVLSLSMPCWVIQEDGDEVARVSRQRKAIDLGHGEGNQAVGIDNTGLGEGILNRALVPLLTKEIHNNVLERKLRSIRST